MGLKSDISKSDNVQTTLPLDVDAHAISEVAVLFEQGFRYHKAASYSKSVCPQDYARPDQLLLDHVCGLIAKNPHIDATRLTVSCADGVVEIDGDIDTHTARMSLMEELGSVWGAKCIRLKFDNDRDLR